ncbi:hypothetical protein Barb4_00310 [Bacteroidales bacterium Barb4]|nr:hypothetical protein Barb4_00310 [Bacteroidales bacterium Barb4]
MIMKVSKTFWIGQRHVQRNVLDVCTGSNRLLFGKESVKKDLVRAKCRLFMPWNVHITGMFVRRLSRQGRLSFTLWRQKIKIEIKTLAEDDRVLKEKTDRITKVKGLGLITAVRYYAKQAASGSLIISGRR